MADNTILNTGTGGDTIRDISRSSVKTQVVQLDAGGQSIESLVSVGTPLPVTDLFLVSAQTNDAPLSASIAGAPDGDFAGVNLLENLIDENSGFKLQTTVTNQPKSDAQRAVMTSDAPAPIQLVGGVGATFIIDTTGYQSLNITTALMSGNVTSSDDMITWSALTGAPRILGIFVTAITAGAGFSFPVIARYIRIVVTTAGSAVAYLRSTPWNAGYTTFAQVNLGQVASNTTISAGASGTLAVGGNIGVGVAQTNNPLVIGGVDPGALTRRLATDTSGRPIIAAMDQGGTPRALGANTTSTAGTASLNVQTTDTSEGQSITDILSQILTELRIIALYNAQLPQLLNAGVIQIDDPVMLRNDPTIFNN